MPRNLFIVVLFCLAHYNASCQNSGGPDKKPVPVIFDTDIGPDYDDVGAMALLHAFADQGECTILATMASNKFKFTGPVLDILNTYFKRPGIPVGVVRGNAVEIGAIQKWDSMLVSKYPHDLRNNEQAEDALTLYRKILGAANDNSVTIITVGFFTNMSNLLNSSPDQYSPLNGKELVRQKVKQLVSMAGCFDGRMGAFKEFNVKMDAPASQNVFDNWPGTILFSGFEIGAKIFTGLPIVNSSISHSPVKDVFAWSIPLDPQDKNGRMSWDETAVLVAVRGAASYYDLVAGKIISKPDGSNTWDLNGNGHYFLKEKMPVVEITKLLDELIMHQPRK
ncbi:MAG TPA: nucleoside hydrolase [Chitinophagaceae bacterium]